VVVKFVEIARRDQIRRKSERPEAEREKEHYPTSPRGLTNKVTVGSRI